MLNEKFLALPRFWDDVLPGGPLENNNHGGHGGHGGYDILKGTSSPRRPLDHFYLSVSRDFTFSMKFFTIENM